MWDACNPYQNARSYPAILLLIQSLVMHSERPQLMHCLSSYYLYRRPGWNFRLLLWSGPILVIFGYLHIELVSGRFLPGPTSVPLCLLNNKKNILLWCNIILKSINMRILQKVHEVRIEKGLFMT